MRSGYSDDLDQKDLAMWRGRVARAIRGKRGQKLLRELLTALDAMPDKRLIANEFATAEGEVCALGAVAKQRGFPDLQAIDSKEHDLLASRSDVASCLVQEIEFENDEGGPWSGETQEQRWERVRKWVVKNIAGDGAVPA